MQIPLWVSMAQHKARFIAIVHTDNEGNIEEVSCCDNYLLTSCKRPSRHIPEWLRDTVALLRFSSDGTRDEPLGGVCYTKNMLGVFLSKEQYREMMDGFKQNDMSNCAFMQTRVPFESN